MSQNIFQFELSLFSLFLAYKSYCFSFFFLVVPKSCITFLNNKMCIKCFGVAKNPWDCILGVSGCVGSLTGTFLCEESAFRNEFLNGAHWKANTAI